MISQRLTLLREARRTFLFLLMLSLSIVKPSWLIIKKPFWLPKYWLKSGFLFLVGFLPGSTVTKADPLITKPLTTFARCMVSSKQQLHHTIQEATHYVNGSTVPYSDWCEHWPMSISQTGQTICHLWFLPTMSDHMHQLALQPYELMFGCKAPMPCDNWLGLSNYKLGSVIINRTVTNLKLSGWISNWTCHVTR